LLYLSDTSEEEEQIIINHAAFPFGTTTGGDVPQIVL
jgi:hypothetical protein